MPGRGKSDPTIGLAHKAKAEVKKTTLSVPTAQDVTLADVFFWVKNLDEQVTRLSQVESATYRWYEQQLFALEDKIETLSSKMDNMTNTFTNLVRRLQTIIDIREGQKQ